MAKGAYLTSDIRQLIAETYLENRSLGPTKTRQEVLKKMKETGLDKTFGPNFPSLSSIHNELAKCRENDEKRSPQSKVEEQVWSLFSYYYFEVPPEVLPVVLQVWLAARKDDKIPITNREIKWVIRLYKVIDDIDRLRLIARDLAFSELIGEILNVQMMGHPARPLRLIEYMTGRHFSKREVKSITSVKMPEDYYYSEARRHIEERKAQNERTHRKEG